MEAIAMSLSQQVKEIKFFIHDLRIDRFFQELIRVHRHLVETYEAAGLEESRRRHSDYIARLQGRLETSHAARTSYELAVKSRSSDEQIVRTGRAYIDACLEACRIALLPHWRNFEMFVAGLPNETPARRLESEFHELKNWIAAIDRRIIDFIRTFDEQPPMEPLRVDELVRESVDTTLRSYVRSASGDRVTIRLGALGTGMIYADDMRFRRLLFNLVMNAVDAMRDKTDAGVIRVSVETTDLTVAVRVSDEGKGMTPDKVDQILHAQDDLRGELHSLGFRFVRQTVQSFNGKITVDSALNEGTAVRMTFPRYHPEAEDAEGSPSASLGAVPDNGERGPHREPPPEERTGRPFDRAGAVIVDDFCRSLAPLPGCLFSLTVDEQGHADHFVHKAYDPDWLMGHEDLAPMFHRAVFRGRYETDDRYGTAIIMKAPHSVEDYWEYREVPEEERHERQGRRLIHNEYIRLARFLVDSGMEPSTKIYITGIDEYFEPFGQTFESEPFSLETLADQSLV